MRKRMAVYTVCRASSLRDKLLMLVAVLLLAIPTAGLCDIPDSAWFAVIPRLEGMYKVASSTDPLLPATQTHQIFLDFGRGIRGERLSGSVAISVRRNPHVKVRIMAWQYFPQDGKLVIGNPCFEGAREAVARGVWLMKSGSTGIVMERGNCLVVLQRADPKDY